MQDFRWPPLICVLQARGMKGFRVFFVSQHFLVLLVRVVPTCVPAMATLQDVRIAMECPHNIIGPIQFYVCNFASDFPWPKKFTYRGCRHGTGSGLVCGKSIKAAEQCNHDPLQRGSLHNFENAVYNFTEFSVVGLG